MNIKQEIHTLKTAPYTCFCPRHEGIQGECGGTVPFILNLGSRYSVISFMQQPLYP